MPNGKGAELMAEFLVKEREVPCVFGICVFGICGLGDAGLLDALHDVRDDRADAARKA